MSIQQRLNRLEKEIRIWRNVALVSLVMIIALWSFGASSTSLGKIEASEFILRDTEGRIRANLYATAKGTFFFDP